MALRLIGDAGYMDQLSQTAAARAELHRMRIEDIHEDQFDLIRTATGMRNAGAERVAVVSRLVQGGFDDAAAQARVDQIDTEMAFQTGVRPADMRTDIVQQADQRRAAKIEEAAQPDPEYLEARRVDRANKMIAADESPARVVSHLVSEGVGAQEAKRMADQAKIDMTGARTQFEQMHERAVHQSRTKLIFAVVFLVFMVIFSVALTGTNTTSAWTGTRLVFSLITGWIAAVVQLGRALAFWWSAKNLTFAQYVRETYTY